MSRADPDGGLFAGGFNLFVGGGQLGDPQVVFDAVVEELGLLRHKALQIAQIFGVDLFHRSARKLHAAFLHLPEPHQKL